MEKKNHSKSIQNVRFKFILEIVKMMTKPRVSDGLQEGLWEGSGHGGEGGPGSLQVGMEEHTGPGYTCFSSLWWNIISIHGAYWRQNKPARLALCQLSCSTPRAQHGPPLQCVICTMVRPTVCRAIQGTNTGPSGKQELSVETAGRSK